MIVGLPAHRPENLETIPCLSKITTIFVTLLGL
jgi:hypothetical protein